MAVSWGYSNIEMFGRVGKAVIRTCTLNTLLAVSELEGGRRRRRVGRLTGKERASTETMLRTRT